MSPLASQALSQYWLVEAAGSGAFTISHLTTRQYLSYEKSSAVGQLGKVDIQGTNASTWNITLQRLGGYSIVSTSGSTSAICSLVGTSDIDCELFVPDGQPGYNRQRWQMQRTGS